MLASGFCLRALTKGQSGYPHLRRRETWRLVTTVALVAAVRLVLEEGEIGNELSDLAI